MSTGPTPTLAGIEARARATIARHFHVVLDRIQDKTVFEDDLDGDSLDRIELAMALEDEFDIAIEDDDAGLFVSVAAVMTYLSERAETLS